MKTTTLNVKAPLIAVLAAIFLFSFISNSLFAQVVIGSGTAGGIALIPGPDGFILNGNKVYDRAGNVKDVVVGNGIYKTKEINSIGVASRMIALTQNGIRFSWPERSCGS